MVDVYIDIDKSIKHREQATNIKRCNWIIIQMAQNRDGVSTVFISRYFIPLHVLVVKPPVGPYLGPGEQNQVSR